MTDFLDDDPLADHIRAALAPCNYEGLLSRSSTDAICRSKCGSLPAGMTSLFGFECQLGQKEPNADFLVRIGTEPGEWPMLELYAGAQQEKLWRRIRGLLEERAKPDSLLSNMLQNLWLEYDLVNSASTISIPSAFFGTSHLTRKAESAWAVALAETLRGEPLPVAVRRKINDLIEVLPEAARIFQIGVMCARPQAPLRVCVIGQKSDEISAFLAAARWPGEWAQVAEVLEQFASVIDSVAIDLDILEDGQLAPKLGVELYQKQNKDLGLRVVELVKRLADNNLCIPEKATGLLAWSGITHERRHRDIWPAALMTRKALRGRSESSMFCRWLHHIKIVFDHGALPAAKAYLAVSHVFMDDSVLHEVLQKNFVSTQETRPLNATCS